MIVPVLLLAIGVFDHSQDIGAPAKKGAARAQGRSTYRVTGGGSNIWTSPDSFHLVSRAVKGDVSLTADVAFPEPGGNAKRKAGVMLRASLEGDAPYADLLMHGDGSLALQFRRAQGGATETIATTIKAPATLRLERHGDVVSAEVKKAGAQDFQPIGAFTLTLPETVHAGLAVCAHDDATRETALFRNVTLTNPGVIDPKSRVVESTLEIVDIETGERHIVRRAKEHFEAPNWSRDGRTLIYNGRGRLWRLPVEGGTPQAIDTGALRLNNDHGISPDGTLLALSGAESGQSQIFVVPITGGTPRQVVSARPSYWHGWSPDGKTLAYCAQRNGEFDIYTVPVTGGEEKRITNAPGLDDGPDYSPDGQWIYINSERSGLMRIWRIRPDGSVQEMVSDGPPTADWFAHPSPDGHQIVYLSFDQSVKGHPANKDVQLRLMPMGAASKNLVTLFGGQGTINVNSWAPDSKRFAFVSYRLVAP